MSITKEQALELADKWLLCFEGKVVLRDNMNIIKSAEGWRITAKTTPIILGMETEIMNFSINAETGEIGVCLTIAVLNIPVILKEIDERKDLDEPKKEQVKEKVREVDEEVKKEPIDKKKMSSLKKWFEDNASFLKDVISIIAKILSKLS
jgi:hypothetical protein